ncbi:hypothetical protein [Nocardia terpenica]|uniref:hypothetical protein n=1 Tax=Nocardia terpenica TaxID=455432 RepID=UPI0012FE4146|nr:hypothetical protein [Nocardia terpenica]
MREIGITDVIAEYGYAAVTSRVLELRAAGYRYAASAIEKEMRQEHIDVELAS